MNDIVRLDVCENFGNLSDYNSEKLILTPCNPVECINYIAENYENCERYTVYDKVPVINRTLFHCYVKCPPASSAVTNFSTFAITFATLIFVLLLSSKRGH